MRYLCLLLYLGYGVFFAWFGIHYQIHASLIVAALPLLAVVGLGLKRKWAWKAACASSLLAVGSWLYASVVALSHLHLPYPDLLARGGGILITIVWPIIWIAAGIIVYRIDHRPSVANVF